MPRAMLLRVKRLEAVIRPARMAVGLTQPESHEFMRRLAVYADLFNEFMEIAEQIQTGAGDGGEAPRVQRLCDSLAAREARA